MAITVTDLQGAKPRFTQWETDRVLTVSGTTAQPVLRFANGELARALVVVAEETETEGTWTCKVPNFVLQVEGPLFVSVIEDGEEDREIYAAVYNVLPRLKPQDYAYEENIGYVNWVQKAAEAQAFLDDVHDWQSDFDAARDEAIIDAEAAIAIAKAQGTSEINTAAQAAAASLTNDVGAAVTAGLGEIGDAKDTALGLIASAGGSVVDQAQQYANEAADSADAAEGSVDLAAAKADAAADSATAAAASAAAAAESAMDAETAQGGAETAQEAAEDAQEAAEAAQAAAEAVLESIPEDYTELTEDVANLEAAYNATANMEDEPVPVTIAGDGYVRAENGNITSHDSFAYTDYVDVSAYLRIIYSRHWSTASSPAGGMAFYDENKDYLSGVAAYGSKPGYGYTLYEKAVPEGAKYARFSTYVDTETYGSFELYGERKIVTATNDNTAGIVEQHGISVLLNGEDVIKITDWQSRKGYDTSGTTVNVESPGTVSSLNCTYLACQPGDRFTYTGRGSSSYRPWAWLKSNGTIITRGANDAFTDHVLTAPDNAAYVIFNVQRSLDYNVRKGAWVKKQDKLTFDEAPTENSGIPVTSGGVFAADQEMRDAIGTKDTDVTPGTDSGYYWNSETSTAVLTAYSSYRAYEPLDVTAGQTIVVHVYQASSAKQWPVLLVDDDYTIIGHYGAHSPSANVDLVITVPDGATKLLVTTYKSRFAKVCVRTLRPAEDNSLSGTFDYKGKTVAIIGDSISTNGNWSMSNPLGNVPEFVCGEEDIGLEFSAYVTYYDVGTTIGGHEITEEDVGNELTFTVSMSDALNNVAIGKPKNNNAASIKTWWEVASEVLGFDAIPVCWSGSSITSHEENKTEDGHYIYKCSYSWHESQIRKCGIREPGSMTRTAPDMVIIFRGANDLTHSPYSRITDYLDGYPSAYPADDTYDDSGTTRYDYVKGMRLLINKLRTAYPKTKIVLCTMNYFRRLGSSTWTTNGTDNWQKYNEMIRRLAAYEGCDLIDFAKDGLNWANAKYSYYNEGTSESASWTHPNTAGHAVMGQRALLDMRMINDVPAAN